jgi:acyl-CoA synthetase (AMP-forming)/AMP-acid ligase II
MEWNIADLFEATVDAVPEREALVAGPARRTYAELERRANRLAHHLAAQGVSPGEHVGIHASNSAEFVEGMLACYKLRAVPININYRYVEAELAYLFDNADLVALIHQRQFTPRVAAIRGGLPKLRHFLVVDDGSREEPGPLGSVPYEEALAAASDARDFGPRSPDDHYLLYTGGTTGMPKGVVWRQHDVIFTLGGGIDHVTGTPHQHPSDLTAKTKNPPMTSLALAPLMHGASQWATLAGVFVGNKVVLYAERSFDPAKVWELVERERVNVMMVTGDAMGRPLADELPRAKESRDLSSLVALSSTAAIFSPSVKAQFKASFPNLVLTDSVGSSEGGFNGTAMYDPNAPRREGAGVNVRPGRDTIVLGDDGRPVQPGSGAIGKIARGGNVPLGYYKDPKKTAEVFIEVDGKRYSVPGDFAKVEADGTLTLLGRGSVCINSGGEKIYPEEVEAALKSHPDVFDAMVVGVPDERWGERVTAVVQPREGRRPTLDDLAAHCRPLLAGYKVPKALHLVPQIQRQPSGKPDYPWAKRTAMDASRG